MRTISRVSLVVAVSAALVGSVALPATAADSAGTAVTVEIPVGVLSISAPGGAAFGEVTPGTTATVAVDNVQVTDTRAGVLGWSAQVIMSDLVGTLDDADKSIPASGAIYTPTAAQVVGVADVAPSTGTNLTTAKVVQEATAVVGINTASWDASLDVAIPGNALAADYTGTLTHSFL